MFILFSSPVRKHDSILIGFSRLLRHFGRHNTLVKHLSSFLLLLMMLHAAAMHGFAQSVILCTEDDGNVQLESEIGPLLNLPAESAHHPNLEHHHAEQTLEHGNRAHNDVSLATLCKEERPQNRKDPDQQLNGFWNRLVNSGEILTSSRFLQRTAFLPPVIEQLTTRSLQTVVLLN
jgi:hypothetical protein